MPFQNHTIALAVCLLAILLGPVSNGLSQTWDSPPPAPPGARKNAAPANVAANNVARQAARNQSVLVKRNRTAGKKLRANGGQPLPPPSPQLAARPQANNVATKTQRPSPNKPQPSARVAKLKPTPPSTQAIAKSKTIRQASAVVPIPIVPGETASAAPSGVQQASFHSTAGHVGECDVCCCNLHCSCGKYIVPLGTSVNAWMDAHIYEGWQAQFVMYHYDFYSGPDENHTQLKPAGKRKLTRLIARAAPWERIVVQPVEGRPQLSQARKISVMRFLGTLGTQVADSQVVVAEPEYLGLKGVEARIVDRKQLRNLQNNIGGAQSFGGQSQGNQNFSGGGFSGTGR